MSLISKLEFYKSYIPIIVILAVSPFCTLIFNITEYELPEAVPFEDAGLGSILNLVIFLSVTIIFGILLIYLIKKPTILKFFSITLLFYLTFTTNMFYIDAIICQLNINMLYQLIIEVVIPIILSIILVLSIYKNYYYIYSTIILFVSAEVGVLLNMVIPLITKILILIGYSIFDYYSVTRGFINKIFTANPSTTFLDLFLIRFSKVGLGIGDLIFYSLLVSLSIDILSPNILLGYLISSLSIIVGHAINLSLLLKRKLIPALPIPIILCLTLIFIARSLIS